jgi:hypothetical protein
MSKMSGRDPTVGFLLGKDEITADLLRQADKKFREIAEHCRLPILFWESDQRGVIWTNNYPLLDHKPEAFFGWQGADLNHDDEREANLNSFVAAQTQRKTWSRTLRLRHASGRWRWVLSVARPASEDGMIGMCQDITTDLITSVPFLATCPNCKIRQTQHEYSRAVLLMLLSHGHPIEAYCPECDEFWAISVHERARLADWLGTQFSG